MSGSALEIHSEPIYRQARRRTLQLDPNVKNIERSDDDDDDDDNDDDGQLD